MGFYKNKRVGDPKWIAGDEEHHEALAEFGVSVDALSRTRARPVRWLVQDIIPHEAVTLVAGDPGCGKTFFACQLAADATRVSRMRVVLATSGDESAEVLRWRLEKAEGDSRRVALATLRPNGFYDKRGNPTAEELDERMAILYETLQAAGDPKSGILPEEINVPDDSIPTPRAAQLLVIDDIDGWFGKPGNLMPAAALARAIQRLNQLARSLRVAVVVLARSQLSVEGRITTCQLSRLSQAASVVWMVVKDRDGGTERGRDGGTEEIANCKMQIANCKLAEEDNPQSPTPNSQPPAYSQSNRRWFLPVKNNLAADVAVYGRAFEIFDGQIRWHADDPAPSLADALLPSAHNSDRRRLRQAAMLWIERALADGPLPSKEFYQLGIDNGHSKGTLVRAATELGIHPTKTGFNGGWEMRWVPQPVVQGRGTTAKLAGAGFKIVGGKDESGRVGEGKGGRGSDGATERRREEAIVSCASSQDHDESEAANCEPSTEPEESEAASCASSLESDDRQCANCASSTESEKSEAVSCESSMGKNGKLQSNTNRPHPSPGYPLAGAEGEGTSATCASSNIGNPKSEIENPKSGVQDGQGGPSGAEERLNVYAAIVDALQESCLKHAG